MITACTRPVAPEPAVIRITPPPWDAPRDAVSYIEAAGLTAEPLNSTGETHIVAMTIEVDGWKVPIPAYVGMDRLRAQRAVGAHPRHHQPGLAGGPGHRRRSRSASSSPSGASGSTAAAWAPPAAR